MKKSGLGRGLDVLLPSLETEDGQGDTRQVPVHLLDPNPYQPRKTFTPESLNALADSIRSAGLIQPILVMETGGRYRIIAGERRFRAARIAGLKEVPVVIRQFTDDQQLEIALIENLQREDLNPIEEAQAISDLIRRCRYTQEAAAERLGMSRPRLANSLRLLSLPKDIRDLVVSGRISAGHARVLCGIADPKKQRELAARVIADSLSVRQLEELAARQERPSGRKRPESITLELRDLQELLSRRFGMKTTITGTEEKGRITICYGSRDELESLMDMINE